MKITDIDVDKILFISPFEITTTSSSEGGFLKKLFGKKLGKTMSPEEFYKDEVQKRGVDLLREELTSEDVVAWQQQSPYQEYPIVLTSSYLFIPGQDIICLDDILKFGMANLPGEHWQYARDRMNEPYDPTYVSEFEGEETYEIDRFKVLFSTTDKFGQSFKYEFLMEVADRPEFVSLMKKRSGAVDFSDDDVLNGRFSIDS